MYSKKKMYVPRFDPLARERLTRKGVVFASDCGNYYIETDVEVGAGTILYPNVFLFAGTLIGKWCTVYPDVHIIASRIGDEVEIKSCTLIEDFAVGNRCEIGPSVHLHHQGSIGNHSCVKAFTLLEGTAERPVRIGARCSTGPFAHIRESEVGSSCELSHIQIVRAVLKRGVVAKHFGYLGDAEVGARSNIAAGMVTANYDGMEKNRTVIEEGSFIGVNAVLVAPVRIGREAAVAAGATVTYDVPPHRLALGVNAKERLHPVRRIIRTKEGWEGLRKSTPH